jgi:predicted phosphodiesterase
MSPKNLEDFAKAPPTAEFSDKDLTAEMERRGWVVHKPQPPETVHEFDTSRIKGDRVRLGIISDTHFGSKYQQPTYLREFMRYAVKAGRVDAFIHGGDVTDGPIEMHKGSIHEKFLHTYDSQRDYAVETLPEVNRPIHLISGNHDDSYLKNAGGEIVDDVCSRRDDLTYLGSSHGYMRFGDVLLQVDHPHDGGSYALSYKLQKRIESMSPERKPHILLCGNYHKAVYLSAYRNVEGFLLPAYQAQTKFMVDKAIANVVGGLIIEFGVSARKGIAPSFKMEWVIEREPKEGDW